MTDYKIAIEDLQRLNAYLLNKGEHGGQIYGDYLEKVVETISGVIAELEKSPLLTVCPQCGWEEKREELS